MHEVTVNGHCDHEDEANLRVAGRWDDPGSLAADAATIDAFLRENVPSGTVDRLTVILMRRMADDLENAGVVSLRSSRTADFIRYCVERMKDLED